MQLIDLKTHHSEQDPARFLVIKGTVKTLDHLTAISPQFMRWDTETWIFDLKPVQSYWQRKASSLSQKTEDLLKQIIEEVFQPHPKEHRTAYIWCHHPWQGLILIDSKRTGAIHCSSPFANKLFKDLSWQEWIQPLSRLQKHSQKKIASTVIKRFLTVVRQLGCQGPHDLRQSSALSIKRRFGPLFFDLWTWTFYTQGKCHNPLLGFPWATWQPSCIPEVTRIIDHQVWLWEHLQEYLICDLDTLCNDRRFHTDQRVVLMLWDIYLESGASMRIPICFKNPHNLHREIHQHKTLLYQAEYQYAAFQKMTTDDHTITGWKISLKETICIPPKVHDLFNQDKVDLHSIMLLENKLPISLEQFHLQPDLLIDDDPLASKADHKSTYSMTQWIIAGFYRPLYVHREPIPITQSVCYTRKNFLERTQPKWWEIDSDRLQTRDYFVGIDRRKNHHWLFQDQQGNWFRHGFFD